MYYTNLTQARIGQNYYTAATFDVCGLLRSAKTRAKRALHLGEEQIMVYVRTTMLLDKTMYNSKDGDNGKAKKMKKQTPVTKQKDWRIYGPPRENF